MGLFDSIGNYFNKENDIRQNLVTALESGKFGNDTQLAQAVNEYKQNGFVNSTLKNIDSFMDYKYNYKEEIVSLKDENKHRWLVNRLEQFLKKKGAI